MICCSLCMRSSVQILGLFLSSSNSFVLAYTSIYLYIHTNPPYLAMSVLCQSMHLNHSIAPYVKVCTVDNDICSMYKFKQLILFQDRFNTSLNSVILYTYTRRFYSDIRWCSLGICLYMRTRANFANSPNLPYLAMSVYKSMYSGIP